MENAKLLLLQPSGSALPIAETLRSHGYVVRVLETLESAISAAAEGDYALGLVVIDRCEECAVAGFEVLSAHHQVEWIAVLPSACLLRAACAQLVCALFCDFIPWPEGLGSLPVIVDHLCGNVTLTRSSRVNSERRGEYGMVGTSPPMQQLYRKLERVTKSDAPILVVGETGTGKELVARAIRAHSPRASGPFIAVNCGGLQENLVRSELFGHEKGSFTGAFARQIGSIEAASGGSIFLDEIGDLPLNLQAHLLRFVQDKTIVRLGSTRHIPVDVRIIAATNVDLQDAVAQGRFRQDLYYRLNVVRVEIPPLRERTGDIDLLAHALFEEFRHRRIPTVRGFSHGALQAMRDYPWPGNVRELINRLQHAMIMGEQRLIQRSDLALPLGATGNEAGTLSGERATFEVSVIRRALTHNAKNVSRAARALGISRVTLYRRMEKFGIDPHSP